MSPAVKKTRQIPGLREMEIKRVDEPQVGRLWREGRREGGDERGEREERKRGRRRRGEDVHSELYEISLFSKLSEKSPYRGLCASILLFSLALDDSQIVQSDSLAVANIITNSHIQTPS
jgi:hypothetical protein